MLLPLAASASEPDELPNVVVVMIDTLRVDHTSLEDDAVDTTPGIARAAAEGLTFRRHFANAPWTRPSVASILTGLLPPSHGAQWGDHSRPEGEVDLLPDAFDTLPELLQEHGYETAAFVTNPTVSASLGYSQGFDVFDQDENTLAGDRRAVASTKQALDAARGPIFVWCHLMAPHNYRTPKPLRRRDVRGRSRPITTKDEFGSIMIQRYQMRTREQAIAVYDATVAFADSLVADLMDHIRRRHPDTLVVITSDHGEEFGEHGGYLHSRTLYNELLRVPLVLWGPEIRRGETVDELTSSVDILPTVLDYLGLPAVVSQGRSLLANPEPGRFVYAEKRNGTDARRAWISPRGKLIETKPPADPRHKPPMAGEGTLEFFADPAGPDDVDSIDSAPEEVLEQAQAQFEAIWKASRRIYEETTGSEAVRGKLTEEDLEQLRALGYID